MCVNVCPSLQVRTKVDGRYFVCYGRDERTSVLHYLPTFLHPIAPPFEYGTTFFKRVFGIVEILDPRVFMKILEPWVFITCHIYIYILYISMHTDLSTTVTIVLCFWLHVMRWNGFLILSVPSNVLGNHWVVTKQNNCVYYKCNFRLMYVWMRGRNLVEFEHSRSCRALCELWTETRFLFCHRPSGVNSS